MFQMGGISNGQELGGINIVLSTANGIPTLALSNTIAVNFGGPVGVPINNHWQEANYQSSLCRIDAQPPWYIFEDRTDIATLLIGWNYTQLGTGFDPTPYHPPGNSIQWAQRPTGYTAFCVSVAELDPATGAVLARSGPLYPNANHIIQTQSQAVNNNPTWATVAAELGNKPALVTAKTPSDPSAQIPRAYAFTDTLVGYPGGPRPFAGGPLWFGGSDVSFFYQGSGYGQVHGCCAVVQMTTNNVQVIQKPYLPGTSGYIFPATILGNGALGGNWFLPSVYHTYDRTSFASYPSYVFSGFQMTGTKNYSLYLGGIY
jgi:hypothetical protein